MAYRKFELMKDVELAHNYLTRMVDSNKDFLPYWLIGANVNPAWARHCRVDDAELVASWYEALACVISMLGTTSGTEVLDGFKRHLLNSWGEHGLRFHEKFSWTHTLHSSFHEMGYVISALVRLLVMEPENRPAHSRLTGLIKGLRSLVIELKTKTFWSGDMPFGEPVYRFPNDVYLKGKGWDYSCVTGRGEESIRNGVILHPLVQAYEILNDETALDLAVGTANYLLGASRYFNWEMKFFGHVHSAVWVAGGLVNLGRITGEQKYKECGKKIYDYVLSISSSFGWVPEYAQWHPMTEEHCETCCIKDMIFAGFELIECGFTEYWDVINRFTRNQLAEQQIKSGEFVGVDNTLDDTEEMTFRDIDKRVVGGYSGGTLPNSMSLKRFRAVAGCCVGTAPQALYEVWERMITFDEDGIHVNLPFECDRPEASVTTDYPDEGRLKIVAKNPGDYMVRILPFMKTGLGVKLDGKSRTVILEDDVLKIANVGSGSIIELTHELADQIITEKTAGRDYEVHWRGADVVGLSPEGDPLRLYQRDCGRGIVMPKPPARGLDYMKRVSVSPTGK